MGLLVQLRLKDLPRAVRRRAASVVDIFAPLLRPER
jgi:hypothetical protein